MKTMLDVTAQHLFETEEAIRVQAIAVAGQTDPAAKAIAARTLAALEDMLLLMRRTCGLPAEHAAAPSPRAG